jgi:hypothetical protein
VLPEDPDGPEEADDGPAAAWANGAVTTTDVAVSAVPVGPLGPECPERANELTVESETESPLAPAPSAAD